MNLLFGGIGPIIAGGIGLAPLRSVIRYILANRDEYGDFTILHGARTPSDRLFKDELSSWTDSLEVPNAPTR